MKLKKHQKPTQITPPYPITMESSSNSNPEVIELIEGIGVEGSSVSTAIEANCTKDQVEKETPSTSRTNKN